MTAMERKEATDFPQKVLNLFDGYVHGALSRREFLDLVFNAVVWER
jgi:carboxymethylenebutenolidase